MKLTSVTRKLLAAGLMLAAVAIASYLGHADKAMPLGLVMGAVWLLEEPSVKLLITLGLVSASGFLAPVRRVLAKATDYTVLGTEGCGTVFTTRGATGAVIFTLPAPTPQLAGLWFRFKNVVDQNMTVAAATADTLVVDGDLTADSLAVSTSSHKINGEIEAFCDGTNWFASGVNVGATYTVAT